MYRPACKAHTRQVKSIRMKHFLVDTSPRKFLTSAMASLENDIPFPKRVTKNILTTCKIFIEKFRAYQEFKKFLHLRMEKGCRYPIPLKKVSLGYQRRCA